MSEKRDQLWNELSSRIFDDFSQLPESERQWIAERLPRIESLQRQLDHLFSSGDGENACRLCQGSCCAQGHNHMTLVNLLGFALKETIPPSADFSRTCPFLGLQGCVLPVESRPYNCVTFICDRIETVLTDAEKERFYRIDRELRECYQEFSNRYSGAAMTGLLIREQRYSGQSFFNLKSSVK